MIFPCCYIHTWFYYAFCQGWWLPWRHDLFEWWSETLIKGCNPGSQPGNYPSRNFQTILKAPKTCLVVRNNKYSALPHTRKYQLVATLVPHQLLELSLHFNILSCFSFEKWNRLVLWCGCLFKRGMHLLLNIRSLSGINQVKLSRF